MGSWRAKVSGVKRDPASTSLPFLLGGCLDHWSARFARREDAEAWLAVIVKSNRAAGRACKGVVVACAGKPEIE